MTQDKDEFRYQLRGLRVLFNIEVLWCKLKAYNMKTYVII
jgi:hypothetical protein